MPQNLDQFITLTKAAKVYKVSTKTLRRRRDAFQKKANPTSIAQFIVKTKEGDTVDSPSKQTVAKLIEAGRQPEWLVNHAWLQQEFGPHSTNATKDNEKLTTGLDQSRVPPNDQDKEGNDQTVHRNDQPKEKLAPTDKLIDLYENQIADLKQQIDNMRGDHRHTIEKITGILPATIGRTQDQKIAEPTVVDTTPKPEPVEQKPRTKTTSTKSKKTATKNQPPRSKASEKKTGFLSGLWRRK